LTKNKDNPKGSLCNRVVVTPTDVIQKQTEISQREL
jgi:hypothetical protein